MSNPLATELNYVARLQNLREDLSILVRHGCLLLIPLRIIRVGIVNRRLGRAAKRARDLRDATVGSFCDPLDAPAPAPPAV